MSDSANQSPGIEVLIEQLAVDPQPLRRRQTLLGVRELWTPATVARFYDEVVRLIHVDIRRADRIARSAVWLSSRLGDETSRAASLRAMGHVYDRKRKYKLALDHYEQALARYEALKDEPEVARTLSAALQSLIYLGRYDEALAFAERARDIFSRHGDRLRLARLDANTGNILHRQDRFDEALELYRRAQAELDEIGAPRDVAIVLQNTATCQIGMNDFRDAMETYQRARAYCIQHEMPLLVAVADYNIAYLHYLRGEYTRAIELYEAARKHCHELGDAYREALCDLDQSEMYVELNLSEDGAHLARRALDGFRRLGVGYEAAKAMTNLAISLAQHGQADLALDLFSRARDLFLREGNQAWIATIDLYQALVFYQERRLSEARQLCQSAFSFFAPSSLAGKAALCQLLLARIHLDTGGTAHAREICLAALDTLEQAESPALNYQAWFVLGVIEEEAGSLESAYDAYRKAHENLENLRSHLKAEEMKIAFLKDKLEIYESLVRMCLERGPSAGNQETAFAYIEQAKSRSLADLIAFRAHNLAAPPKTHRALVDRVRAVREELNWYSRAIQIQESRTGNLRDPNLEKLRRAARDCERRLVDAMAHARVEDQEFASLQTAASIDIDAIRSVLPPDATLVEYYRVRDTLHACLLKRDTLKIVPLGSVSALRRALQLLRFQLSKFRLGPEYTGIFRQDLLRATEAHLREFYTQLIAPIREDLDTGHLIIAPHDFLHYLPFHALLDGREYLGDRHSISYTPSASVFYLCSTKPATPATGALVMGVPDPVAPHIQDEVEAVSSVLAGAEVYVGQAATHDVLRHAGARSRFVHVATHGSFRRDNPMFSSISLGDGQLSLFDLYQLSLPAELVTLSGCGTGLNVVVGGDELMGLKRGLLYAGAQAVLLTLWDVNDQSTAEFMKLFYGRLKTEPNLARAIQHAMAEVRREYVHPFYWAPFVLVGKYFQKGP